MPRRLHRDRALRMPPHGASSTVYVDAATSKFAVIRNVPPSSLSSSSPPVAPSSLSSASAWKATRIATASATIAPPRPSMRTGAPSTSAVNRANSRRSRARTAAALRGDDARDRCPGLFAKGTGRTTTVTSRGRTWSLMRCTTADTFGHRLLASFECTLVMSRWPFCRDATTTSNAPRREARPRPMSPHDAPGTRLSLISFLR